MKKILILILIFPMFVFAKNLEANVNGVVIKNKPSNNTNTDSSSCGVNDYYWGRSDKHLEGIRVTFYSEKGEQLGHSVDIWNQKLGTGKKLSSSSNVTESGFTAYEDDSYSYYVFRTNKDKEEWSTNNSRIDYMNAGLLTDATYLKRVKGGYVYYRDTIGEATSCKKTSAGNKARNPLFYTEDGAICLKEYLTSEKDGKFAVMDRYLKLTGADQYASTSTGNYIMVLEPIVTVAGCVDDAAHAGIYTTTEFGLLTKRMCTNKFNNIAGKKYVVGAKTYHDCEKVDTLDKVYTCVSNYKKRYWNASQKGYTTECFGKGCKVMCGITNFDLRWRIHKFLTLDKKVKIGDYEFKAISTSEERYKGIGSGWYRLNFMETTWKDGFGMGAIIGTDLCDPCGGTKSKIVYRTIDLTNPFLTLSGEKRNLLADSNWYGNESKIDSLIYQKSPLYTVTLTPTKIKSIRSDTAKISYDTIIKNYNAGDKFKDSAFKKKFGL